MRVWSVTRLRACAVLLGCAGAFVFSPLRAAAQGVPRGYQQGIFELRLPSLPSQNVSVLVSDSTGAVLLPLRPLLELTGAPYRLEPDSGTASVSRPRGAGTASLDLRARTLAVTGRPTTPVAAGDALVALGDVYASNDLVQRFLEAKVDLAMADLVVTVSRDPPFPSQERLQLAEERHRGLQTSTAAAGPPVPFFPRTGGGVVEWGATSRYPGALVPASSYARVGVALAGGMLTGGGTLVNEPGSSPTFADLTASYRRVFPNARALTQVELGDLVTQGIRARSVRGIQITNAPFARDPLFGQATLAPSVPTGWEYEVYQDGRLLGFSDAASHAPVTIPLQYGSTPVQVRLYGPAGERITSDLVYLVPVLQLPAGRWQYAAAAGICPRRTECGGFAYADLRHGVSRGLTVFGGTDVLRDSSGGTSVRPYGGASLIPGRAWVVELQGMARSFAQLTVESLGLGQWSGGLGASLTQSQGETQSVLASGGFSILPVAGTAYHLDGSLRRRLGLGGLVRALDLRGGVDGPVHGRPQRTRLSLVSTLSRGLLETGYENDAGVGPLYLARLTEAITHGVPRALATPTVAVGAGTDGKALTRWEASLTVQPARAILTATGRWQRGQPATVLLGATVRLRYARAQSRLFSQGGGELQGAVSVDGAAAFGPGVGARTLPYGGVTQGGVSGVVFEDANGNGVADAGETRLKDAAVNVGGIRVKTDARGRYATWSVLPYEVLAVRLDTASVPDPAWVPVHRDTLLRPNPNLFTRVDFPLVQTRELTGALVPGDSVPTAAGLTVEIAGPAGDTIRAITFSDGAFYVGRLLPGRYTLRVAESSLRALKVRAVPATLPFDVPATGDQPLVELPPIRLVRP